jgi:hypothetical protein
MTVLASAVLSNSGSSLAGLPRLRPRARTFPYDLSVYAALHTGPTSWSAEGDHLLSTCRFEEIDAALERIAAGSLLGLHSTDVPVIRPLIHAKDIAGLRDIERHVLLLVDGQRDVARILELACRATEDVLEALASLSAHGAIAVQEPVARPQRATCTYRIVYCTARRQVRHRGFWICAGAAQGPSTSWDGPVLACR